MNVLNFDKYKYMYLKIFDMVGIIYAVDLYRIE